MLRLDRLAALLELQAVASAPFVDLLPPGLQRLLVKLQLARLPGREQILQHRAGIADDRQVDHHVLVDRGGVDVDVDLLGARRELVEAAGDAVVEARADVDHHIAIRSEEHTSELQSLMRISYAVFCLKKKKITQTNN